MQGVRGRIPVIVDGGFRRGTDIYKALALGATAAGIGRPYIPAMQEAIKGSTAKFTAEELITKREQVRDDIKNQLRTKLKEHDILVDEFNIVNFEFSKIFNEAIEAKVTAEQQALAAKNKLEQIKFEADQRSRKQRARRKPSPSNRMPFALTPRFSNFERSRSGMEYCPRSPAERLRSSASRNRCKAGNGWRIP